MAPTKPLDGAVFHFEGALTASEIRKARAQDETVPVMPRQPRDGDQ